MAEQTLIEYDPDDPERPFESDEDEPYEAKPVPAVSGSTQAEITHSERSGTSEKVEGMDTFRQLWTVASQISQTEFVPKTLRGKTDRVFATIIQGRALGVDPMTSLREIWISPGGSPELSAELQAGLVRKAGHRVNGTSTNEKAELTGIRSDTGEEMTITFTIEDAESQGLVQIKDGKPYARSNSGNPLPWERHTAAMLWHRAMTTLVRRLFPDVMIGDIE